jgi:hypothetical protein
MRGAERGGESGGYRHISTDKVEEDAGVVKQVKQVKQLKQLKQLKFVKQVKHVPFTRQLK